MANVVLLYTGNVCSTPMVEFAKLSARILVPIREEFDPHKFFASVTDKSLQCKTLSRVVSGVFSRDGDVYADWPALADLLPDRKMPDLEAVPHTFFKWRAIPTDLPDAHLLTEMFGQHDVEPIFMLRRSLAQHALKVELSKMVYGGWHQQFKVSQLDTASYSRYLEGQSSIRLFFAKSDIDRVVKIANGFWHRTRSLVARRNYFFPHAGRRVIIAEDIFRPNIDLHRYEATLGKLFGETLTIPNAADPPIRKGGLEVEHCANIEDVLADARLVALERKYQRLVDSLVLVSPS